MIRAFLTTAMMLIIAQFSFAEQKSFVDGVELILPGQFHGGEIASESSDNWFGLYKIDNEYRLTKTSIFVNACYDGCAGDTSGICVTVGTTEKPLFLVHGLDNLKEGAIKSADINKEFLYPGQSTWPKEIKGKASPYTLLAIGEATIYEESHGKLYIRHPGDMLFLNYKLILKYSIAKTATYQEIAAYDRLGLAGTPEVLWAGDIDRDGKLDFFMNLAHDYYYIQYVLFLSSMAEDGEILKKVAELTAGSC